MRSLFQCFAPPSRECKAPTARRQTEKTTSSAQPNLPSGVGTIDTADRGSTDVLHYVEGKCCALLFVRAKLQESSIQALLEQQELLQLEHSADPGRAEAFLANLLGAEQAQAAMEAVQQGVPYKTVLERDVPVRKQPGKHGAQHPHPLVPAQLACQSPSPSPSEANLLPLWTFSAQVKDGLVDQPQDNGILGNKSFLQQSPLPPLNEAPNPHSAPKRASAPGFWSSSSSFFDSQLCSSLLARGGTFGEGTSPCGSSTFWSSSVSPSTLHTQGSSLSLQHQTSSCVNNGPYLMPTLGAPVQQASPTCSKALVRHVAAELGLPPAKSKPDADLSHQSLISKAQQLSNTALDCIMSPSLHTQNSGEYDRTRAMLQILQLEQSPANSNQPLPSFSRKSFTVPSMGTPFPHLDNGNRAATCGDLGCQLGATSPACTHLPPQDIGLYIGTLAPALDEPAMNSSPADKDYPKAAVHMPQDLVREERGPGLGCPPAGVSLRAEHPLANEFEDIVEEKSTSSNVKASSEERTSSHELLEIHACKAAFEVSIRPVHTRSDRSKPLAMVNFADISDQMQVQGFLLSLAESQLGLLSSLLPKHAIDFLARQSSATDAIPQNMAKLARSHEAATLLFMDICGFTSLAKSVEPAEIMSLLNTLFSKLDRLTDQFNVTKVETAGDCYIVSAGVLSSNSHDGFSHTLDCHDAPEVSARRVMEFAKAMLQEAAKVKMPRSTTPVQVRVGMHTGNVVSGLIGTKLPKFSIFGDTMNTAARMESTGVPGRIHVSETTQGLLPEYAWESCGLIPIKGKGNMNTYLWDDKKSWSGQPCVSSGKAQMGHNFGAYMLPLPPL